MDLSLGGIIAALIFSSIGFVGFTYGKRTQQFRLMGLGAALMVYPYFVKGLLLNYLVGTVLTVLLFVWRE